MNDFRAIIGLSKTFLFTWIFIVRVDMPFLLNREKSKRLSTFASCQPTSATSSIYHTMSQKSSHTSPIHKIKKASLKQGHFWMQRDWGGEIAVKHGGNRRLWHTSKLKENLSRKLLTDDLVGKWVRERHSARSISLFTPSSDETGSMTLRSKVFWGQRSLCMAKVLKRPVLVFARIHKRLYICYENHHSRMSEWLHRYKDYVDKSIGPSNH
jgi:hypothetical protein